MRIPELPEDSTNLEAALAYAEAGLYVIPVKRGTKSPGSILGKGWQHGKSSTDPKQIAAWFAGTDHDIAIDCGRSGLPVIDIDKPELVLSWLNTALADSGAPYQSTRPDEPGRGHWIFRQPPGRNIGCGKGRLAGMGLDVKGTGGVIIVAPAADGRRWITTGEIPVMPDSIADKLDNAGATEAPAAAAAVAGFISTHTESAVPTIMSAWKKIWHTKIAAGESRHTSAVSVCAGALKEAAAGLFSAKEFLDWFEPEFVAAKTRQPIGGELQLTAQEARKKLWETGGIIPWAIGQANTADTADTLTRAYTKCDSPKLAEHMAARGLTDPRPESEPTVLKTDTEMHRGQVRMAYRLAATHTGKLMFVKGIGWHHWDGTRWAVDERGHAKRAVLQTLKQAITESVGDTTDHGKTLRSDVLKCESANGIDGVLTVAASLAEFACTVADLDIDPWLLNCANGTLDLRTMQLSPHDPADRITKVTRAAHNPGTPTKPVVWQQFLEQVLPDEGVREYLQRIAGMALLGKVSEHILPILTGTGSNGKGTFYAALLWALGDYGCPAEPDLFMQSKNAHPTGQMDLLGRRLVVVSESGEGHRLDEAKMKRLTGGDEIKARRMHRDFVSFEPSHTALFITNHLPKVSGDDQATWRRIRVIPFTVCIPEEQQKGDLDVALKVEADAVLAWAVAGWQAYQTRKLLQQPEAVVNATGAYRLDSDVIGRFFEARCHLAPSVKTTARDLFAAWEKWRTADGAAEISKKAFGQALAGRGYASKKANGETWWEGVSLQYNCAP